MPTSQNGYSANDISMTSVALIPGTTRKIRLRNGAPGWMLRDFAAWFDKNIESIDNDTEFDDWGYAERTIRGDSTTLSNHASGTAEDLNATQHPLGTSVLSTFTQAQVDKIHARLRRYEGCIRWGGDYSGRKDSMHFEINKPIATVNAVYQKLIAPAPAETPDIFDANIGEVCLRYAREGRPMRTTDSCYGDARRFLAWGRSLGVVPRNSENYWATYHGTATPPGGPTSAEVFIQCTKWIQRHFGVTADGVAGPETLRLMKPYGYRVFDEAGRRL